VICQQQLHWFTFPPTAYKGSFFPCVLATNIGCLFSWGQPFWQGWERISV
jgi:hypothetical protein